VLDLLARKRVEWVLFENVPFMLYLEKGRTMRRITKRLEDLGYRWAYRVVDTRAFGLPQRRRRVYLLASVHGDPRSVLLSEDAGHRPELQHRNGNACGFYWTEGNTGLGWAVDAIPPLKGGSLVGIPSPPAIVLPGGRIVTPDIRDAERLQGLKPTWTRLAASIVSPNLSARWRLVGNAVAAPVAHWIGRRLLKPIPYDAGGDIRLTQRDSWPRAGWSMGDGRFLASVSEWPVSFQRPSLRDFLRYEPRLLSARATKGFLKRVQASSLNVDDRFLRELRAHIAFMRRHGKD
jgi:DNA (cytosine-5)-methyltransferase 1